MTNTEHLNIGLARTDGKTMSANDVAFLVAAAYPRLRFTISGPFNSDTEPTAVVTLRDPVNDDALTEMCAMLAQECIARYNSETGDAALVGPKAEEWGPFDPAHFIMPSGFRLTEERVRDAAPDMLAALRDIVSSSDANDGDSLANAIQAGIAAIAKAEGR